MKLFEHEILANYDGIIVLADVEETVCDSNLAIKYDDHGDEFILVRTKDGNLYEYGYFLNRKGYPDPSDLEDNNQRSYYKDWFIRKPKLHFKVDENSVLSNEMYFYINRLIENKVGYFEYGYKKEYSESYAQAVFDDILEYVEKQKSKKIMFDEESYKIKITEYLKTNSIDTEENLKRLNEANFTTRIYGIDGIAGKIKIEKSEGFRLFGDSILKIIINGKEKDPRKISMRYDYDEWGSKTFELSLGQFR